MFTPRLQRYTIIAKIPEPWATQLNDLRKQFDRWSRQWLPPHITIIPPFETDLPVSSLRAVSDLEIPIDINFKGWGSYRHPGFNVIWLDPGTDSPAKAQTRMLNQLPMFRDYLVNPRYAPPGDRKFHITIASRVPDAELENTWSELSKIEVTGTLTIPGMKAYAWDAQLRRWLEVY